MLTLGAHLLDILSSLAFTQLGLVEQNILMRSVEGGFDLGKGLFVKGTYMAVVIGIPLAVLRQTGSPLLMAAYVWLTGNIVGALYVSWANTMLILKALQWL